ncbi:hypothetical protein D9M68_655760 [compost metagenome]
MKVHYDEGIANHIGPEPCAGYREVVGEASVGERVGQSWSRDSCVVPDADAVQNAEGNMKGRVNASASTTRRGQRPWHARTLFAREPGDLSSASPSMGWSASGRRGAVADDERTGEVRLRRISEEACEQCREIGRGVGGAKGGDQGEHGSAQHVPGAEPGKRVTGAGTCTASCKAAEEGAVHRSAASRHGRPASGVVLCAQTQRGPRSGWHDVAVLRRGTRRASPASAHASTQRSVSGTARSAAVHTQAGRQTAPIGDCRTGR